MSMNETKLNQPHHFTVKIYAQRYDGKIPFSVETSTHLSLDDIDSLDSPTGPVKVGLDKIINMYQAMGYSHAPTLPPDVKPPVVKKK